MTDFEVVTSAGKAVSTFADRQRALAFARANIGTFGHLDVIMVERVVKRIRIKRFRSKPSPALDFAIPAHP